MAKKIKKKKQYIVGRQTYINSSTGELIDCLVMEKEVHNDFNFHKVWINDLISILNLIGGKKLEVFKYLMNEMNASNNYIIATYEKIKKDTGISYQTIRNTLKVLLDTNFLRKINNGVYMVNPDVIVKGNSAKREALLVKYTTINNNNEKTGNREE